MQKRRIPEDSGRVLMKHEFSFCSCVVGDLHIGAEYKKQYGLQEYLAVTRRVEFWKPYGTTVSKRTKCAQLVVRQLTTGAWEAHGTIAVL